MPVTFDESAVAMPTEEEEFRRKNRFKQVKFSIYLTAFQLSLLCLFVRFADYSVRADASLAENGISMALGGGAGRTEAGHLLKNLTFQVILVVTFIGSCCSLMKYQYFTTGGQILNLVIISVGFQWSLLCRGFLYFLLQDHRTIRIDVHDLTEALLGSFSLLISTSFVLGRIAPVNILTVIFLHLPIYNACKMLNEEIFLAADPGGTLPIHLFGALYGWTMHVAALRTRNSTIIATEEREHLQHENNMLAYVGSAVLFVGLPFLNGIVSESDAEMTRSIINTTLAGTASLVSSFTLSMAIAHIRGRPISSHILQGSLLSGGIAVGCVATMMLKPFGALAIGNLTGLLTSVSYLFLEPYVQSYWNLPCTCGVLSFHGLSAFISGTVGILMALLSEDSQGPVVYNKSLYPIYPARVPNMGTCGVNKTCSTELLGEIVSNYPFLEEKARSRSAMKQATFQSAGLLLVLVLGVVGGAVNGLLIRLSAAKCGNPFPSSVWMDESFVINVQSERRTGGGDRKGRHVLRRGEQETLL